MDARQLTHQIRTHALQLGFDACGFAKAEELTDEARYLEQWLNEERNASMAWMGNNFEKRVDPRVLVPGAKSVVSLLVSYHHPNHISQIGVKNRPHIAKYAQGRDYHKVLKKKLKQLFEFTADLAGGLEGRIFVDSAPVLDKAWAVRAGLGWVGKNSNILNRNLGSWFFIAEMILDIDLLYDSPTTDHCGSCTACIEACPTNAIYEPRKVDATKCISYLTIEHKGEIEKNYHTDIENWVFGCDICQDVCPWNNKAKLAQLVDLHPRQKVLDGMISNFENITELEFNALFEGSAVRRAKFEGFVRNLEIVNSNLR